MGTAFSVSTASTRYACGQQKSLVGLAQRFNMTPVHPVRGLLLAPQPVATKAGDWRLQDAARQRHIAEWQLLAHQPGCVGAGRVRRPVALRQLGHAAVGVCL
jgi:hypothetical protein